MALLTLKDIGKIYVSEGNVSVGIRGVNLSFDRGEFVAVTGKSGSGKSTLLNVISGMDSYEEGELYIDGNVTSHYLQPEWEEYREKYISFIFQDYNIIESFTVLENVELALMHIEDKKERRKRALALIDRVGLSSHIRHKGSKLSGGQKQRTVIARALAKDSPIILADEPTGNLDSATSKEIIELLHEVSRDKLLIVVTHNFDDFRDYATRHIRIFDGAIEADHTIKDTSLSDATFEDGQKFAISKKDELKRKIKNGITLGKSIFMSKPKLSLFLVLLMIVGTLGIFMMTSLCGEAGDAFKPSYMFTHIDGRLILVKQSGEIFTDEELEALKNKYGAYGYLHYDTLLDHGASRQIIIPTEDTELGDLYRGASVVYGKRYGENVIGRYPEADNEAFLYLPISYQPVVGKDKLNVSEIGLNGAAYKLVGVKYFYDNNLSPECLLTEKGFRTSTALYYFSDQSSYNFSLDLTSEDGKYTNGFSLNYITPSFEIEKGKIYINNSSYRKFIETNKAIGIYYKTTVNCTAVRNIYNNYYGQPPKTYVFEKSFTDADLTDEKPSDIMDIYTGEKTDIIISADLICEIVEEVLGKSYTQASLFFEDDKAAHTAADALRKEGYIPVPSDTTYEPSGEEVIVNVLASIMLITIWFLSILFLSFFVNLCSSRALGAFKSDMAIMRSMGIKVGVIRIGMYVRMLISLIPAFILVGLAAIIIFTSPRLNEHFVYLYAWQYALIFIGMLILTVRTTHKQIKKLFGESVKKSLKGGASQ